MVLWDTFGEMLPAYRQAKAAFIGGSLAPLGGQNFLEALVNGVLPVMGPSWEDIDSPQRRQDVITATLNYIKVRQGGTEIACRHIIEGLESE